MKKNNFNLMFALQKIVSEITGIVGDCIINNLSVISDTVERETTTRIEFLMNERTEMSFVFCYMDNETIQFDLNKEFFEIVIGCFGNYKVEYECYSNERTEITAYFEYGYEEFISQELLSLAIYDSSEEEKYILFLDEKVISGNELEEIIPTIRKHTKGFDE
jgi:hypothetical protein